MVSKVHRGQRIVRFPKGQTNSINIQCVEFIIVYVGTGPYIAKVYLLCVLENFQPLVMYYLTLCIAFSKHTTDVGLFYRLGEKLVYLFKKKHRYQQQL